MRLLWFLSLLVVVGGLTNVTQSSEGRNGSAEVEAKEPQTGDGNREGDKWPIDENVEEKLIDRSQEFEKVRSLMHVFFKKVAAREKTDDFNMTTLSDQSLERVDDGTEVSVNYGSETDLFESDIQLTLPQMQEILREFERGGRKKRKMIVNTRYRWKSRFIPYTIATKSARTINAIKAGLRHWEQNTCLRFRRKGAGYDWIQFVRGFWCSSNVGRRGGKQQISIGSGCEKLGIVVHEIGHALGFWHEQSRSDRDAYITVNNKNIHRGLLGNFQKRKTLNLGVPYDFGSSMHYGSMAFTKNRARTIDTRDRKYRNTIGQREGLSFLDVKQMNSIYCSRSCPRKLSCRHGGYADPNNCRRCKCPDGLAGTCDRVQPAKGSDPPPPSTTRRPRTTQRPKTTLKPVVITPSPPGPWTKWGRCSVTCGGCGIQTRTRRALAGRKISHSRPCGTQVCPTPPTTTTKAPKTCRARVTVPCFLLSYLKRKLAVKDGHQRVVRSDRKATGGGMFVNMCTEIFRHKCGEWPVTGFLGFKVVADEDNTASVCCSGYKRTGNVCLKIK